MDPKLDILPFLSPDSDTSDEEYVQNEEAAAVDSDVSSDLDEDEMEAKAEKGNGDENEPPSGDDNPFSDDDDLQVFSRPSRKNRVLDSDDDDSNSATSPRPRSDAPQIPPPSLHEETCSMSIFGDNVGEVRKRSRIVPPPKSKIDFRRPSVLSEEASMPPLFLNESFESNSSEPKDPEDEEETLQVARPPDVELQGAVGSQPLAEVGGLKVKVPAADRLTQGADSGVGVSIDEENKTQSVAGDGNSLESNFNWTQVLPPAQPRKDNSLDYSLSSKMDSTKPEVRNGCINIL